MSTSRDEARPTGLRERKKAKTLATIQRHAMRLFAEQGYAQTTIEQIAEAAEISPSTFYRYFPTKEQTVLYDSVDPELFAAFLAQPAELGPVAAFRTAIAGVYRGMSDAEVDTELGRQRLVLTVPELRGALIDGAIRDFDVFAGVVATRMGREPADFAARMLAGAMFGVLVAALVPHLGQLEQAKIDDADALIQRLDEALATLEDR
ncbi:TetR family transcriptional regulator [Tamaricihabitans halophyticus]|uniref:TetR family transcriptional regulator n=1 Tax=Tamaricihabitans halophyticus TaxID=1262583 RepID=A0A4V2SUD1_9PSEU|nr:TetR family transcriptional regulator [Tamaricihabitans halophyticus]TCP54196.1 TetR family transcriptional regulator [Tamaricihabitans halophyticus]